MLTALQFHSELPAPLKIAMIMSTEVGLNTQYLNWRGTLTPDMGLDPEWITIDWVKQGGRLEKIPLLPNSIKSRIRSQIELLNGLKQGPYDALFIAALGVMWSCPQVLKSIPYFVTTDTTPIQLRGFGDHYKQDTSSTVKRLGNGRYAGMYQGAQALFPWSNWTAQSMIDDYGADPKKVHVIPPGLILDNWPSVERTLNDDPINILFVGGDFERKGGDLLLEWSKKTKSKNWALHLVTRDKVTAPKDNVKVYNGLNANDPVLRDLFHKAHIFALPTRADCYSIAGMEAMASGLPVILGHSGGTGDVIKEGVTGYLIGPGDGATLETHLDYLIANPEVCLKMGRAARADVEDRYDMRKNAARIIAIIRETIAK